MHKLHKACILPQCYSDHSHWLCGPIIESDQWHQRSVFSPEAHWMLLATRHQTRDETVSERRLQMDGKRVSYSFKYCILCIYSMPSWKLRICEWFYSNLTKWAIGYTWHSCKVCGGWEWFLGMQQVIDWQVMKGKKRPFHFYFSVSFFLR